MNREESFGAWLLKHMHLLKALHLKGTRPFFSDHNLAPALRAAAASEQGLRLVSFSSEDGINNGLEVLSLLPVTILRHLRMCVTETVEGVSDRVLAQTEGQSQEDKHAMEYSFEEVERDPLRSTVDVAHVFGQLAQSMHVPTARGSGWGSHEPLHSFRLAHDHPRMAATLASFSNLQSLAICGDSTVGWDSPLMHGLCNLTSLTQVEP